MLGERLRMARRRRCVCIPRQAAHLEVRVRGRQTLATAISCLRSPTGQWWLSRVLTTSQRYTPWPSD